MIEPLNIHAISEREIQKEFSETTKTNNGAKKHPISIINNIVRQEGVTLNKRIWNQLERIVEKNWKW